MYEGLVIVFHSFELSHLKHNFIVSIRAMTNVKLCLVSNSSNEKVLESLVEIALQCKHVDVVNVNRKKSNVSAVRSGARYLSNNYNIKHLGFIAGLHIDDTLNVMNQYRKCKTDILNLNSSIRENKPIKQTFNQSLFSVPEYLEKLVQKRAIESLY